MMGDWRVLEDSYPAEPENPFSNKKQSMMKNLTTRDRLVTFWGDVNSRVATVV